jgi:hypothetical protein
MSYDGYIEWHGRDVGEIGNYTTNVGPMWSRALGCRLQDTSGWDVRTAAIVYRAAVDLMRLDPEAYWPLAPKNGWGTYEGAMDYLSQAADVCDAYRDDAVVRWSA